VYWGITTAKPDIALGLSAQADAIASIVAGFAFTMLGFLAAVITILFSVSGSPSYKRYKNAGLLDVFFWIYYATLACLILTAGLALVALSSLTGSWGIKVLLGSFANNLVQVLTITVIICNLANKGAPRTAAAVQAG